jgi:hypothetical protein
MLVMMALITTASTIPILNLLGVESVKPQHVVHAD